MDLLDFHPSARATADVVRGIADDQLAGHTVCTESSVADLLDHLAGLTYAFTAAATKTPLPEGAAAPIADGTRLEPGWRETIPAALDVLAAAWADPSAYDGLTQAGPVELPAEIAALVALNEVVVHGWDLAGATGQAYAADPAAVEACRGFVASFEPPADGPGDDGTLFGPPVPVAADAPPLHHLLGAAGRDPGWTA